MRRQRQRVREELAAILVQSQYRLRKGKEQVEGLKAKRRELEEKKRVLEIQRLGSENRVEESRTAGSIMSMPKGEEVAAVSAGEGGTAEKEATQADQQPGGDSQDSQDGSSSSAPKAKKACCCVS